MHLTMMCASEETPELIEGGVEWTEDPEISVIAAAQKIQAVQRGASTRARISLMRQPSLHATPDNVVSEDIPMPSSLEPKV